MKTKTVEMLREAGIRPSPQRVALLESVLGRRDHPSAETVFADLRRSLPTLSRTTVLNTLRLFRGAGLIRDVRAEEGVLRFDGRPGFHAHFKCRGCGGLFDVAVPGGRNGFYASVPPGFSVDDEQLIYYGFCNRCSNRKQNKGKQK